MARFDVHRNTGTQSTLIPYIVIVQSSRFAASRRRGVIPLVVHSMLAATEPSLNPAFEIERNTVVLHPLQMVSMAADRLGAYVCSLEPEGDRILAAIDLLVPRAWG